LRNIYEQIDRSRRKSIAVIVFFIIFVTFSVWGISQAMDGSGVEAIIALLFTLIVTLFTYFQGDRVALALAQAHPVRREEEFNLYTVTENLSIAAQIPTPKIYLCEDRSLNAFATGRDPDHASICITRGLLEKLDRNELAGVIGHEMSHIKNYDTRLFAIVAILIGSLAILSRFFLHSRRWRGSRKEETGNLFLLLGLILAILSPVISQLIKLAISRKREYFADSGSVMLTRQPSGLIGALEKISQNDRPLKTANNAMAHFYIANPFKTNGHIHGLAKLFNTHPPIEERIRELKEMV